MKKEKLQEFATRVSQSNRSELVVVIYEAILASIEEGKKYLEENDITQARKEIERAKGMLTELMTSLDMQYTVSYFLQRLYEFAYRELCQGIAKREPKLFTHATDVLEGLLPSFQEVAKQDNSAPVMENVQTIYAGLTYGRESLNETLGVGVNRNRGYEV